MHKIKNSTDFSLFFLFDLVFIQRFVKMFAGDYGLKTCLITLWLEPSYP